MADFREDIANLVESLVVPLVDDPDAVEITSTDTEDGATLVEISVADEDTGKVIGRQGRVIKAIRTLCRAAGSRNGAAVEVEIIG
ncbi:MAG TPA: KH domain-containing protein [Eggerthellaceae bacterium]|nr:KH domain-containing protein [Eggerthellaceae bacterium]